MAVFFGINDKARKVNNLYIGINGKARKIKAGWIGINGKARLFYSGAVSVLSSLTEGHYGYRRWDSDDRAWYYNTDVQAGGTPNYGQVSGNTLTVKARYYGGDEHYGRASKVGQVDLTGKTAIKVTYYVNSNGADGNTGQVILLHGTGSPAAGTARANMISGYTQIGAGAKIGSGSVGRTYTDTYNISISGRKYLMVLLEGDPGTTSRDSASAAASVTIQSVELIG